MQADKHLQSTVVPLGWRKYLVLWEQQGEVPNSCGEKSDLLGGDRGENWAKNKETVDALRNQNQLSVQGYREGGKGREEEVKSGGQRNQKSW